MVKWLEHEPDQLCQGVKCLFLLCVMVLKHRNNFVVLSHIWGLCEYFEYEIEVFYLTVLSVAKIMYQ
jgi:hypothetical protein